MHSIFKQLLSSLDHNQLLTVQSFINDLNSNKLSYLEIKTKYNLEYQTQNSYSLQLKSNSFLELHNIQLRFYLQENKARVIFNIDDGKDYNNFQFFYESNNVESFYGLGFMIHQEGFTPLFGNYHEEENKLHLDKISKSLIDSFIHNEEIVNTIIYNHKDLNFIKESLAIIYDMTISDSPDLFLIVDTLDKLNKQEKPKENIKNNKI